MAKKSLLLIRQSGVIKQILSAGERPNGDLIIGLPIHRSMRTNGSDFRKLKSRKVSIHRSENSGCPGYTFTHEVQFCFGRPHKGYAFVRKAHEEFLFPFFHQLVGRALPEAREIGKNENPIRIASYDADVDCLFLSVVVTESTHSLTEANNINLIVIPFRWFNLNIVYGFAQIKTPLNTLEIFAYSGDVREGIPVISEYRKDLYSSGIENLDKFIGVSFGALVRLAASKSPIITPPTPPRIFGRPRLSLSRLSPEDQMFNAGIILNTIANEPGRDRILIEPS
ncbi:MAG: hypothetical protein J7485_07730 [Sphingobium sp.]|nr:hypothetical protein [Sphingobium sp.]